MAQLEINYALAMKDISLEKDALKDNQIIVKDIIKLIEENEDFEKILSSSFIIKEEKHNLIDKVFSSSINKDLLSFFHVIIENNRANLFLSILKEFNSLCNEYYGVVEGLCYSAFLLDKKQIEKLEKTLSIKEGKTIVLKISYFYICHSMAEEKDIYSALKEYFGFDTFKEKQEDIILDKGVSRLVKQIIYVYEDGTFEIYNSR